jgi:hypothetical protein
MSGVLHLYFTLLMNYESLGACFDGPRRAWHWIVDVLNLTPRPNITAEMLAIFFKCCGYRMQRVYGRQFGKLINVCSNEFMQLIKSIPEEKQSNASVGRLETILEHYYKNRTFPEWKS